MKIKNKIIFYIFIALLMLPGCEKKQMPQMDLRAFLPLESNAKKYIYKIMTKNESSSHGKSMGKYFYQERVVTSRDHACVYMDEYVIFDEQDMSQMSDGLKNEIKENKLANGSLKFCADSERIFYDGYLVLYQDNGDWVVEVEWNPATGEEKKIQAKCHFISLFNEIVLGKKRNVIHTQCQYEIYSGVSNSDDWFIAEGLGLYKHIMTMDDKNTDSHGTITTLLVSYK